MRSDESGRPHLSSTRGLRGRGATLRADYLGSVVGRHRCSQDKSGRPYLSWKRGSATSTPPGQSVAHQKSAAGSGSHQSPGKMKSFAPHNLKTPSAEAPSEMLRVVLHLLEVDVVPSEEDGRPPRTLASPKFQHREIVVKIFVALPRTTIFCSTKCVSKHRSRNAI